MAGVISESYLSRRFSLGQQAGRELVYDIVGAADESEAETLLLATAPSTYLGLAIETAEAEPLGNGVWKGYARYVRIASEDEYTFDTTGGTQKITQSFTTVNSYAPAGLTAPDFQGAIGVSDDRVEGTDIIVPQFSWTETHRISDATMTGGYRSTLFSLTGKVNNATWNGYSAGEVLFQGASGSRRGDELWSITFRFAASPNQTGLTVGSITSIAKNGWDYLWVRYADYPDPYGFALVKRPVAAYVERVYERADFSALGF